MTGRFVDSGDGCSYEWVEPEDETAIPLPPPLPPFVAPPRRNTGTGLRQERVKARLLHGAPKRERRLFGCCEHCGEPCRFTGVRDGHRLPCPICGEAVA